MRPPVWDLIDLYSGFISFISRFVSPDFSLDSFLPWTLYLLDFDFVWIPCLFSCGASNILEHCLDLGPWMDPGFYVSFMSRLLYWAAIFRHRQLWHLYLRVFYLVSISRFILVSYLSLCGPSYSKEHYCWASTTNQAYSPHYPGPFLKLIQSVSNIVLLCIYAPNLDNSGYHLIPASCQTSCRLEDRHNPYHSTFSHEPHNYPRAILS